MEDATLVVKSYLAKMLGLNSELYNRPLIDWLEFRILNAKPMEKEYIFICDLKENLFSQERLKYKIIVDKASGEIVSVSKEDD